MASSEGHLEALPASNQHNMKRTESGRPRDSRIAWTIAASNRRRVFRLTDHYKIYHSRVSTMAALGLGTFVGGFCDEIFCT